VQAIRSVEDNTEERLEIYSNSARDMLQISLDIEKVILHNITGQKYWRLQTRKFKLFYYNREFISCI